mgnify:CR=1 FL=1
MTATSILLLCLKELGAQASYYVPNRLDEGYGLNADALRTLAAQGASMVVTVLPASDAVGTVLPRIAALIVAALALGVYSFTLPHTPPPLKGEAKVRV